MPGIILTQRDSFDDAYRKFKRQCDRNLIVTEARARQNFETQTEKNKKKRLQLARKSLKNSSCLEDTKLDSNKSKAELLLCRLSYIFIQNFINISKPI